MIKLLGVDQGWLCPMAMVTVMMVTMTTVMGDNYDDDYDDWNLMMVARTYVVAKMIVMTFK